MFNKARELWDYKGENPTSGVLREFGFDEEERERFMDASELPAFFESLSQELNETIRDYLLISLLTGARRSNVCSLEWTEINWHRETWTIPKEKAKSKKPIHITLSPAALQILGARQASRTASQYVFPGRGKSGHLVEPKTAWKRVLKRAGLTDLRLHDLRRTFGSWQAGCGASLAIIGKSLGHGVNTTATQVYARLDLDPIRASVNKATSAMLAAGNVIGLLGDGNVQK